MTGVLVRCLSWRAWALYLELSPKPPPPPLTVQTLPGRTSNCCRCVRNKLVDGSSLSAYSHLGASQIHHSKKNPDKLQRQKPAYNVKEIKMVNPGEARVPDIKAGMSLCGQGLS